MSTSLMRTPQGGRMMRVKGRVRYPYEVVLPHADGSTRHKLFACKKAAEAYLKRMTEQ